MLRAMLLLRMAGAANSESVNADDADSDWHRRKSRNIERGREMLYHAYRGFCGFFSDFRRTVRPNGAWDHFPEQRSGKTVVFPRQSARKGWCKMLLFVLTGGKWWTVCAGRH